MDDDEYDHLARRGRAIEDRRLAPGSLCGRCRHAHIFRREGRPAVTIYCTALEREVPADIVECSRYSDPRSLALWEMRQIAHLIDPREGVDDGSYL